MTIIKYATVGFSRTSEKISIHRGNHHAKIGFRPSEGDDLGIFDDPIFAEKVVELPESMTPTEYDEYMEEGEVGSGGPITDAILEVAEEKGVDTSDWDWPALKEAEA